MTRWLEVLRPGALATVQDRGRTGHRVLGVSPSGAADRGALDLANRLVGNPADAAVIEATLGGLALRVRGRAVIAVTGAPCAGVEGDRAHQLPDGATMRLGRVVAGLRSYVAVRGGVDVTPVLGSRSTDTLSGLGPPPLGPGDLLPVGGDPSSPVPSPDQGSGIPAPDGEADPRLVLTPGPRDDWLPASAWSSLDAIRWTVSPVSDRVAVRLEGPALPVGGTSLPPEALVRGAVQVPPDGRPIIFLADHPVTGGYPVIGVLTPAACDQLAQLRPGRTVTLSAGSGPAPHSAGWAPRGPLT